MSSEFKFRALTSEDWKEVAGDNLMFDEGLKLKDTEELKDTEKNGTYTSESLDSGISGCFWHRIVLDADIPENSTISITFSTSEIEKANFSPISDPIVFTKTKDALIQVPSGRYIRLQIDLHREGKKSPVLKHVKVYYERLSYLRYLPAIYQENEESRDFLERFLSIFESSLYDSEEKISSIPTFFDPMAAPEEFYRWLADWLSLDLYDLLEENQKREFILNAVKFYKKKGTVSGLADLVTLLTGKRCCIKEYKNNVFRSWGMEHDEENGEDDSIPDCRTQAYKDKPECTKFYRKTSRTVDSDPAKISSFLTNKGKYCDEMHYVTGISLEKTGQPISYFSNSIGIFVLFPFGERLQIERHQLHKIIDSFLPVFVKADITYVETTSLEESYWLNWIDEEYLVEVTTLLEDGNDIQYIMGDYDDKVEGWKYFYAYCRADCPPKYPSEDFGRTYNEKNTKLKNFRTVHQSIGFTFSI